MFHNVVAGLTVSFVAISLGAAFGILSERGAFAGIISAGIIALVTAVFGGTRVQCSGPTAPMTAVSAVVVAYAYDELLTRAPGANPDNFINVVFILTGVVLLLAGVFRLGRFIQIVPRVVVSGFMDGIAILIWLDQLKKLFEFGGASAFEGSFQGNLTLAIVTFALVMGLPNVFKALAPRASHFLPATLITIIALTFVANIARLDVEYVNLTTSLRSFSDVSALIASQVPHDWSVGIILLALPFAFQLAMLGYLDTLLTSLVVDKLTGEATKRDRELAAQGIANSLVAFVGGIPGAQATIRSVLIIKERGTLRLAGIMVGVFVLIEMVLFQDLINLIPQAVFSGLLFKVGYDVFDWRPLRLYFRGRLGTQTRLGKLLTRPHDILDGVTHWEALFVAGTTLVTVLWSLNAAVIGFSVLFYVVKRWAAPLADLDTTTEGLED